MSSLPRAARDPFLEIDARQEEVLERLDELNTRLERLLSDCQESVRLCAERRSESS
jgi:hypothetical protein